MSYITPTIKTNQTTLHLLKSVQPIFQSVKAAERAKEIEIGALEKHNAFRQSGKNIGNSIKKTYKIVLKVNFAKYIGKS